MRIGGGGVIFHVEHCVAAGCGVCIGSGIILPIVYRIGRTQGGGVLCCVGVGKDKL